jgi:hypothetical protein
MSLLFNVHSFPVVEVVFLGTETFLQKTVFSVKGAK